MLVVKCNHIKRTTSDEDVFLYLTDTEVRRHREQTGFDTLVVYAVNDAHYRR